MDCKNGYTRLYHSLLPIVGWFGGFLPGTAVIPELYWNAYSSEQRIKWITCTLEGLINFVNSEVVDGINKADDQIEQLAAEFEKFRESGFDDYYAEQVAEWIDNNLQYIFDHVVKMVFFGLTDDGRFCAYVPSSWSDIQFDTGAVYGQFDYGRLILRYNVDGSGVIDNTGRYDETEFNQIKQDVERLKRTLYTLLNQGG